VNGPSGGEVLWHLDTLGWAMPTFDDAAAYFPTAHRQVMAVDKQSGKVRWISGMPPFPGQPEGSFASGLGSAMAGGTVVTMDLVLYGFSPQTGELRWTFKPPFRIQDIALPGTDGTNVYTGTPGGMVYSLDGGTGTVRWATFVGDSAAVPYSPVTSGGNVYVSFTVRSGATPDSGGIMALDAATGNAQWRFYFPRATPVTTPRGWIRPAVAGNLVVAPTEGTALYALDRVTGKVAWQGVPGEVAGQGIGAVAASQDRVFVGFNSGDIVALDAATGREIWRSAEVQLSVKRIIADRDRLYVTYLGPLGVLDASTGTLLWRTSFPVLEAVVDDNRVYAAGSEGLSVISAR